MGRDAGRGGRAHTLPRIIGRFLAGHHLDGKRRSDATFWCDGTQGDPSAWFGMGRESRWVLAAGWKRAAVRLGAVAVLVCLWRWRHTTEWVLALVGGPVLGLLAGRAIQAGRRWRHTRELERPVALALAPYLGMAPRAVEDALTVRPDFEDAAGGEHVGALGLPDHWAATPDQRSTVEQVIGARFGMDLRYQWQTARYPMLLNLTRAPVPPALVPFAEVRGLIEACPPERVFLGLDADGKAHYWDRDSEDPHIAMHGGSRRGKTSALMLVVVQDLHRGGGATWIDPKQVSAAPLAGVARLRLYNDPRNIAAMWKGIAAFRELVEDRYDALSKDPTLEFPRELLILDEVSMFSAMSAAHWRSVKERSDPATPPCWGDVAAGVWMGAQCHAHVIVAGQRLDYATLGGMLGSFGVRLLAGFTAQDYNRLVGLPPVLRSQKPRGRFLLYEGGELTWLQLALGKPQELRDYALTARPEPGQTRTDLRAIGGTGTPDTTPLIVGLDAAARHLGMKPDAFRKARQRRPVPGEAAGPDGRPAWPAEALTRWRQPRPSAESVRP
jgi:hypothetical protein